MTFGVSYNFIGKMGGWELGEGVEILSIEQGVLWYKMIFCLFYFIFCIYRCEGVLILVPQKDFFYHLDQEYCLDSCQFVKCRSCKISVGFRFYVCVLKVESLEVRG